MCFERKANASQCARYCFCFGRLRKLGASPGLHEGPAMRSKTSYAIPTAILTAVAFGSPAFACGEAGKPELRDLGAKFIGYTSEAKDDGSVDVRNAMFVQ